MQLLQTEKHLILQTKAWATAALSFNGQLLGGKAGLHGLLNINFLWIKGKAALSFNSRFEREGGGSMVFFIHSFSLLRPIRSQIRKTTCNIFTLGQRQPECKIIFCLFLFLFDVFFVLSLDRRICFLFLSFFLLFLQ